VPETDDAEPIGPREYDAGSIQGLPAGRARRIETARGWVSVWNVDGRYVAVDDRCPHQGASLARGFLDGNDIVCGWHGMRYDVDSGDETVLGRLCVRIHKVEVRGGALVVIA
jgi:3-phenylpropionate/trans-cinnamate dioxygenase ferredoxin subunit